MVCSIAPLDLYWAIGFVLGHWRLFFSIRFEFQVITSGKVVKHLAIIRDLGPVVQSLDNFTQLINRYLVDTIQSKPRIKSFYSPDSDLSTGPDAESLCDSDGNWNVKCGNVVSGKRCVAWNVTRDVGWTLGELSGWGWPVKLVEVSVSVDLLLQCPSQVAAESSLSLARRLVRIGEKVVIAELGDWDMHAEHKQYIFKAITKTFDKPESLAISTKSQKHLYQSLIKVS